MRRVALTGEKLGFPILPVNQAVATLFGSEEFRPKVKVFKSIAQVFLPLDKRIATQGAIGVVILGLMTGIALTLHSRIQSSLLGILQSHALEESITLQADELSLQLFTLTPGFTLTGLSTTSEYYNSKVYADSVRLKSRWGKIATGNFTPDQLELRNAELLLQPQDLDLPEPSSRASESSSNLELTALLTEPLPIPDASLTLSDVQIKIAASDQTEPLQLTVNGHIQSTQSVTSANLDVEGSYHQLPIDGSMSYHTSQRTLLRSGSNMQLDANLADSTIASRIVTAIVTDRENGVDPVTATISAHGDQLGELMASLGGPAIETGALSGEIAIGKNSIEANDLDVLLGRADLQADLKINTKNIQSQQDRPSINLSVQSDYLSLDELIPHGRDLQTTGKNNSKPPSDRVFSTNPPALFHWVQQWDANVRFNASEIVYKGYDISDLSATALFKESKATFQLESPQFAGGTLKGNARYDTEPDTIPSGFFSIGIHNMNLNKFSSEPSINDIITDGRLTTHAEFWFSGLSQAALAASVDGEFYALLEDGQLDSMAVEVAGADIMESLRLLWRSKIQQIKVSCGYTSMHFSSGVGELEHFIVDTDDTLFSAAGTVDLNNEKLDLTFKPIPHDASLLTATTPINIKGTLANPKIRPGKMLYARIAAAAVLVSLTGPAAAIIPFIGIGDGEESSSCMDLFKIQ